MSAIVPSAVAPNLRQPICSACVGRRHRSTSDSPGDKARLARPRTIFSGIQPTGIPHIGNYLGALQNWVRLQDTAGETDRIIFSVVDLHAITVPQAKAQLQQYKREMLASLLAIGLDPDRCILYEQSSVPEHTELSWILSTMAPLGALNRMTQFKSKAKFMSPTSAGDEGELDGLMLGLFAYPVLQAADILLYKTTLVPVGEDQAQHLELSRSLARTANGRMGKKVFTMPETLLSQYAARVGDLRDPVKKMSKSATNPKSRISIIEDPDTIRKKISGALTDSQAGVSYEPLSRPGIANLLDIYASFTGRSHEMAMIVEDSKDLSHRAVKEMVADAVIAGLAPIRERFNDLDIESDHGRSRLDDVKHKGKEKARKIAQETMAEVREHMGLI